MSDRTRTLLAASAALLLLGLTAGCGGPPRAKVSGTVTLDGQPVESGTISFYPTANSGPTAGGGIENGRERSRLLATRRGAADGSRRATICAS